MVLLYNMSETYDIWKTKQYPQSIITALGTVAGGANDAANDAAQNGKVDDINAILIRLRPGQKALLAAISIDHERLSINGAGNFVISNPPATAADSAGVGGRTTLADHHAALKALVEIILKSLHFYEITGASVSSPVGDSGNYTFSMAANGNVSIHNNKNEVVATAMAKANIDDKAFAKCNTYVNADVRSQCIRTLSYIAEINKTDHHTDMFTNLGKIDSAAGTNREDKAQQLAEAYSILKSISWLSKGDRSALVMPGDIPQASRVDVKALLVLMTEDDHTDGGVALAREAAFDAPDNSSVRGTWKEYVEYKDAFGALTNLTDLGKLIVKCIEVVNQNPGIITTRTKQQIFERSDIDNSSRLNRISTDQFHALKMATRPVHSLYGMYGAGTIFGQTGGQSELMLSYSDVQEGGANTNTNTLRTRLNGYVARLHANGQMLAPQTYNKFEKKFAELEESEKYFLDILKKLKAYNDSGDRSKVAVTNEDIESIETHTNTIRNKVMTINTGIQTLKISLDGLYESSAPKATSGLVVM
jgi:hypothetical protein